MGLSMENDKINKVFRSRQSVLIIAFILAIFIPCTILMMNPVIISGLLILGVTFLLIVSLFGGMRYIISGDELIVKMWIIPGGRVKIADITLVERSYNPLSAPAASLKRLRIVFRKTPYFSYTLISPVREQEFIEELKAINPNIRVNVPVEKGRGRIWDWDI